LPVFSLAIGTFGYAKPIANIANDLRAIGIFGNGKTNCQYCQWSDRPTARPPDRPINRATRHAPPGMDRYADQISQSFCLLDRFCFWLFAGEAPPRADGLAGRSRWAHKKFFYF